MTKPASANHLSPRAHRRIAPLLAAIAFFGVACSGVGDALCPEGTDFYDKTDSCPYGPPGGPKRQGGSSGGGDAGPCAKVDQKADADCANAPTWSKDVYPLLDTTDAATAGCTLGGCHGQTASGGLSIPGKDAQTAYSNMSKFMGTLGRPYINTTDPASSWIVCNISGKYQVMPPGGNGVPADALTKVTDWVACGAKNN